MTLTFQMMTLEDDEMTEGFPCEKRYTLDPGGIYMSVAGSARGRDFRCAATFKGSAVRLIRRSRALRSTGNCSRITLSGVAV